VERTHAWGNQYGKLRWCTERRRVVVAFWRTLANAAVVCGRLVRLGLDLRPLDGRPRRCHDAFLAQALRKCNLPAVCCL
jgi:hypothetical protein